MSENFQSYDDEIDLFELFETLWSEKFLIAGITFICGVIGTFYAFIATPTYKAEVHLLPAEKAVMAIYNPVEYGSLAGLGIPSLSADVALTETLNQIRSVAAVTEFAKSRRSETFDNQSALTGDELFEAVAGLVSESVKISENKIAPQTIVSYQTSDAIEAYAFLSELLVWAQNQVQAQHALEISNVIERRLEANDLQIQLLTQTYERRLGEDLAVLEEALAIASELNITNNQAGVFVAQGEGRLQEANTLYLKGIKLLSAEIAALKERIKDSRFLRQVRLLEEENQTLNDLLQIELPKGTILAIDKPASVPQNPIAPNKKLILALSVVLGGMLGVLYVLVRSALRNRQLKPSV